MPERDKPLDIDDLPSIQVEKDDKNEPAPAKQAKPEKAKKAGHGVNGFFVFLAVVLLAMLAGLGYIFYQQHKILLAAEARIGVLESKLNTTDESLSKSSVEMQVQLVTLQKRTDELWTQMDKLWASAWRRNQSDLTNQAKDIESLNNSFVGFKKQLDAEQAKREEALKAQFEALSAANQALQKQLKTLNKEQKQSQVQLNAVAQLQDKLNKTVHDLQGWVDSSQAFRKQTNQSLSRLDKKINALQKTSP